MALGSTQLLTEMSTRNLPGGKGRSAFKADNFTAICERSVYKIWDPRRLTTLWVSMACYRDSSTFFIYQNNKVAGAICMVQESLDITVSVHLSIISHRTQTLILNA
jgi:hypothetical protein